MAGTLTRLRGAVPTTTIGRLKLLGLAVSILLLVLIALGRNAGVVTRQFTITMTRALYIAIFAMCWDMASGYTGEISFGHALFFGSGAYGAGMLYVHGVVTNPWLAILGGSLIAMLGGILVGWPSLRVEGPYFSLITLVAPLILLRIFIAFSDWTGGVNGLTAAETSRSIPNVVEGFLGTYLVALVLFLVTLTTFLLITRSNTGEILTAIRENEDAVAAAGLNPKKFKIFAFVVSGFFGGLAGALFAFTMAGGGARPSDLLVLQVSIEVILVTVLGGIGTITGAAFGGIAYHLLNRTLDQIEVVIPLLDATVSEVSLILLGVITLLFLFFVPWGLIRVFWMGLGRVIGTPEPGAAVADGGRTTVQSIRAKCRRSLEAIRGGDDR